MQDIEYSYTTHTVQLSDGIEITYVDEGQGDDVLLMIHGLGSYLPAWKKNIEGLKSRYRCIALDLPGYGKSTKGDYAFTMHFFANVVAEFVDRLRLENVVLVGHSMGGQIATTTLLTTDIEIEKLVLLAPAGFETFTEQHKTWFGSVFTAEVVEASTAEQIEKNFALNFSGNRLPADARFMYEDRLLMKETGQEYVSYANMIPKCVMAMLNEPVFDRLPDIRIPVLIIYGKEDLLIPNRFLNPSLTTEKVARAGHAQFPDSVLKAFSGCGHFVQWECAGEVNAAVVAFLKE